MSYELTLTPSSICKRKSRECRQCDKPFTPADGEPMTFAGLWDEWKDKATGEVLKSCTMLITEPNDFAAEVHDRMPVVLESKDFASWLNIGGSALLRPAANDVLQRWPVSRRVNSSRAPVDDPTLSNGSRRHSQLYLLATSQEPDCGNG